MIDLLTDRHVHGLRSVLGASVFTPGVSERAPVVSVAIAGWSPNDAGPVLDQSFDVACRTELHCVPDACRTIGAFPAGTIRFSPGYFTRENEIDAAVAAVAELAASPLG